MLFRSIRDRVGADQFFLFGHTVEQINELMSHYCPWQWLAHQPLLDEALSRIEFGEFSQGDRDLFVPLVHSLKSRDPYAVIADMNSYTEAQALVDLTWSDVDAWRRRSILTTARSGFFSSDRAIRDDAVRIWNVRSFPLNISCPLPLHSHEPQRQS